jgi:hypothetical protein
VEVALNRLNWVTMRKHQKSREKVSKSENSVIKPDKRSKKKKKFILTEAAPYPSEKGERLAALLREALLYTANEPVIRTVIYAFAIVVGRALRLSDLP